MEKQTMKNMEYLTKNLTIQWATPLLGLLTAHHWMTGTLTSTWWWVLIVIAVLSGNIKR